MKIRTQFIALILAFGLLASLCACSKNAGSSRPVQTPVATAKGNTALTDDTLVLTVNGEPVYWDEFKYWMHSTLLSCGYVSGDALDWDATFMGKLTLREYLLADAVESATLYKTIQLTALELGIKLDDEDRQSIKDIVDGNIEYFGSKEAYQEYLKKSCLNDELMQYLLESSCYYYKIFVEMFGENGERVPDSDAVAYGLENGYYRAKHILLSSKDENDEPYSEDILAEKRSQLEGILEQLKSAEDPTALFDELMHEHSEDPGLESSPDGYQFAEGEMVDEFQSAVEELYDYEFSDIVEMPDFGYTIIMRLPLNPNGSLSSAGAGSTTLRYETASFQFESFVKSWCSDAYIEYGDAYNKIDPAEWF